VILSLPPHKTKRQALSLGPAAPFIDGRSFPRTKQSTPIPALILRTLYRYATRGFNGQFQGEILHRGLSVPWQGSILRNRWSSCRGQKSDQCFRVNHIRLFMRER
jgi:hypothetical protein